MQHECNGISFPEIATQIKQNLEINKILLK